MVRKKRKARGRERSRDSRAINAILFITLGLVGAFAVSSIAGVGPEDVPAPGTPADRPLDPAASAERWTGERSAVRVEILNGAGVPGLAREATSRLREAGFDVVFYGNADRFGHGTSVVLDRVGNGARARAVARALGIDSVASVPDPSLILEVSVILGGDWPPAVDPNPGLLERARSLLPGGSEGGEDRDDGEDNEDD